MAIDIKDFSVFVACERSGVIRNAFNALGIPAISCDLFPSESPGPHIIGNFFNYIHPEIKLLIVNYPCTYLSQAGMHYLYSRPGRSTKMFRECIIFSSIFNLPVDKICVEQPVQHRYASISINRKYDQIINPYEFGHPEKKRTCLFLKNLPVLLPTCHVINKVSFVHRFSRNTRRGYMRSITFHGIAQAMAEQWSPII